MSICGLRLLSKVLLLFVFVGAGQGFYVQSFAEGLEDSIDEMLKRFDRRDAPGVAVGVVKDGGILYAKGKGMADLEQDIPLTPDSVFDIASVSKQFAGLAIAMLESEEKLKTTDPIREHVAGLPEVFAPVQLRHLLHHTSGIRDWPGAFVLGGRRFDDVITFQDILSLARRQEALSFEPGEMYSYSNTGYNLLARTVETVTGQSFSVWTDRNIFEPLEMDSTHFYEDHDAIIKRRVRSYTGAFDGPFENVGDQLTALGSSSLYSSVHDLLKWIIHFDQPSITSPAVIKKAMTPGTLKNGHSSGYAYGFGTGKVRGAVRISHSGGWAGFRTYLLYYPEFKVGVVVLSNWAGSNVSATAYQVADKVLGDDWAKLPTNADDESTNIEQPIDLDLSDDWLAWAGSYLINNNPSSEVMFFKRNGVPWLNMPNGKGYSLKALSSGVFFNRDHSISVHLTSGVNDWPRSISVESPDWNGTATQSADAVFAAGEGASYEGEFYSTELLTAYQLRLQDGELVVHHQRHTPVPLVRFGKDRFTSNTWFWKQVDFDRDFQGEVTALRVTQGRNRNMLFRKVR